MPFSSSESDDEDDNDDDDDDDDDEDVRFASLFDSLSSPSFSCSCSLLSLSDSAVKLLREERLDDRDRADVGLEDFATGSPGTDDLSGVLCELRSDPKGG